MSILRRIHSAATRSLFRIDDFDLRIIDFVKSTLPKRAAFVLNSQLSLLNKMQEEYDDEKKILIHYFYQMYFGKSIRTFPNKFSFRERTEVMAEVRIDAAPNFEIFAKVIMVDGVFFCIEFRSSNEDFFRPLTPNFEISLVHLADLHE